MAFRRGDRTVRVTLDIAASLLPDFRGPSAIAAHLRAHLGHPPTARNIRCWVENRLALRDPDADPVCKYRAAADADRQARHYQARRRYVRRDSRADGAYR